MPIAPAPQTLWDEGHRLVGEGDRIVKVAFVEIAAYRVAFYVDVKDAAEALAPFKDQTYEEMCASQECFTQLAEGRFRKTMRFSFLRRLSKAQVQSAFRGQLSKRVGPDAADEVGRLIGVLSDVAEGDVMTVCCRGDGQGMEVATGGSNEPPLELQSAGLWLGFQRIYFDANTEMPAIRAGAVRRLPEAVFAPGAAAPGAPAAPAGPSRRAGDAPPAGNARAGPAGQAGSDPGAQGGTRQTWRDAAGRLNGKSGYKFGDVTRSLIKKTKGHKDYDASELIDGGAKGHDLIYLQEIADLRSQVESLGSRCRAAEGQLWPSFRAGALVGVLVALLLAYVAGAFLAAEVEKPLRVAVLTVLSCAAPLALRQHCRAVPVKPTRQREATATLGHTGSWPAPAQMG